MRGAAPRVPHVVQTIKHRNQVKIALANALGRRGFKANIVQGLVGLRMPFCFRDRGFMEIKADECAVRIGLRHQQRREADAATDVGDLYTLFQPGLHAVERRDPALHDGVDIGRAKERAHRAEEAASAIAPSHAGPVAKRLLDLFFAFDHGGGEVESSGQVDRTVLDCKHHRLLGRETETLIACIKGDITVGRLRHGPFAHVAFRQPVTCARGQLLGGGRAMAMQSIEETKSEADARGWYAECTAKIAEHLADEGIEFFLRDFGHNTLLGRSWPSLHRFCAFQPRAKAVGRDPRDRWF